MAAQIASTPIVKGQSAIKIFDEANKKRTAASQKGVAKLTSKFDKKVKQV